MIQIGKSIQFWLSIEHVLKIMSINIIIFTFGSLPNFLFGNFFAGYGVYVSNHITIGL